MSTGQLRSCVYSFVPYPVGGYPVGSNAVISMSKVEYSRTCSCYSDSGECKARGDWFASARFALRRVLEILSHVLAPLGRLRRGGRYDVVQKNQP